MKYEYWFANIKGVTGRRKAEIRGCLSSAEELYYMEETALEELMPDEEERQKIRDSKRMWNIDEEYERLKRKRIHFLTQRDKEYPARLRSIPSPPYAIYVKGRLPKEDVLSVAIVGARECSQYGASMAKEFAGALAGEGVQVISGMARGIDGVSQRAALNAGGKSFAVLGCGVDICYPMENRKLYEELEMQGGILSEQPPGTQPLRQFFPARNRIISGLADVVLVMEAKERSGSLITADMALEQGKDVYALPGQVCSVLSSGCHRLIRQGAGILLSPKDLLEELGIFHKPKVEKLTENKISLETPENLVYSFLGFEPKNLGQLLELTKLELPALINVLVDLEIKGYVREVSKNYYVKLK